jgi:hypothetical protein
LIPVGWKLSPFTTGWPAPGSWKLRNTGLATVFPVPPLATSGGVGGRSGIGRCGRIGGLTSTTTGGEKKKGFKKNPEFQQEPGEPNQKGCPKP